MPETRLHARRHQRVVAVLMQELLEVGCAGPFTPHRRLVNAQVVALQRGARRRVAMTRPDLLFTLAAGDVDDLSRATFPGAVVSALRATGSVAVDTDAAAFGFFD